MKGFNEIRKYIMTNINQLGGLNFTATDRNSKRNYTAVYLVDKPETHDLISGNGIIINYNEIGGGQVVRRYNVEMLILSKEPKDIITIKKGLIDMLDFYKAPSKIASFNKFRLNNDGGTYYDPNILMYKNKLYFDCNLI